MKTQIRTVDIALAVLTIFASIAGCTGMGDARHRYDQGWRVGDILQIGQGTTAFSSAAFDCRGAEPGAAGIEQQYAYVLLANKHEGGKYFNSNSNQRHAIIRIPPAASFREGERVYVNIRDCKQLLVHH